MFVAALILLLVAALMVIAAALGGGATTTIDLGRYNLETNAAVVFFLGMAALLLLVLSLAMFRSGAKRASARRADRKKVSELSHKLDAYRRDEHSSSDDVRGENE